MGIRRCFGRESRSGNTDDDKAPDGVLGLGFVGASETFFCELSGELSDAGTTVGPARKGLVDLYKVLDGHVTTENHIPSDEDRS
jgi:hypothetical protein